MSECNEYGVNSRQFACLLFRTIKQREEKYFEVEYALICGNREKVDHDGSNIGRNYRKKN